MKQLLITIAALVLVGCSTTQQLVSQSESRTVVFNARSRLLQDGEDIVKSVDVKWQAKKPQLLFAICGQDIGVIRHRADVLKWHHGSMHSYLRFAHVAFSLFIAQVPA